MIVGEAKSQPIDGTVYLGAVDRARVEPSSKSPLDSGGPPNRLCKADLGQADLSDFIFGQFQIKNRLGQGGMGVVYRARHLQLEKDFAIKFIADEISENPEARERFVKEFKSLGKLQHPNIVSAVDAGSMDGISYYVTELLNGHDLPGWLARRPLPSIACACELIRQAALGLQHSHAHGLLHRDIKPSNLFLETSGNLKLLDFGLVSGNGELNGLTRSNQIMGTVDYMSPEQAENPQTCTPASDIYSLGATLIYLLSGCPPFPDKNYPSAVSKLRGHLNDVPLWLDSEGGTLPKQLRSLVARMLAKSPKDRPQSADDVVTQLSTWSDASELTAWIHDSQVDRKKAAKPSRSAPETRVGGAKRNSKWIWSCIAAGSIACASASIFTKLRLSPAHDQIAPANSIENDQERRSSNQLTSSVSSQTLNARALRINKTPSDQSRQTSFAPKTFSTRD